MLLQRNAHRFLLCNKSDVLLEWLLMNNINEVDFTMQNEATEFHFKKDQRAGNTGELDFESTSN